MDISATALLKATRRLIVNKGWPVTGAPCAGASSTVLLVALSLSVAGCQSPQPRATGKSASPPQLETKRVEQPASATKPPVAPLKAAQPVPVRATRVSEAKPPTKLPTKPPRATAAKEAERPLVKLPPPTAGNGAKSLLALDSSLAVRARERATLRAKPSAPKAPTAENVATVTGAPVEALVFHGTPPKARPPKRTVMNALGWIGLVLGGAVLALLVRLHLIRRSELLQLPVGDAALKMPRELGFKEPLGAQKR